LPETSRAPGYTPVEHLKRLYIEVKGKTTSGVVCDVSVFKAKPYETALTFLTD
jgi:hypothetical protein